MSDRETVFNLCEIDSEETRCPICGYRQSANGLGDDWSLYEEGEHSVYCNECEYVYEVSTRVSYSFSSPPRCTCQGDQVNTECPVHIGELHVCDVNNIHRWYSHHEGKCPSCHPCHEWPLSFRSKYGRLILKFRPRQQVLPGAEI